MILILIMHLLYGCTFTIGKILIFHTSPLLVIGIRMTLAGILLSLYNNAFIARKEPLDRKSWNYILQLSIFGLYFPYALRFWALQYLTVIKTALLYNIAPFGSFLFSYIFFKEKTSPKKWIGLIIGCSGIIPLLIAKSKACDNSGLFFLDLPEIAMIIAVLSFSYGWVVMKKLVTHTQASPIYINGITMLICGILSLATSLMCESMHPTITSPLEFTGWLLLIILITNIICYNMYAWLLKKYSATLLSLAGLIAPASSALTSWLYFGEKITWDAYVSSILVIIGSCIFYFEELNLSARQKEEKSEQELDGILEDQNNYR